MIIQRLWKGQPGRYFCLSTKSSTGAWRDHFFTREQFNRLPKFIEENDDKDIYFCPHGFSEKRRLKRYAELPKLLWADMDDSDPRRAKVKPTVAIESSPSRYVGIWVLNDTMTEDLNKELSYALGCDKGGWDLTQVLRVPGTTNWKYNSEPKVKIVWSDGPSYSTDEIKKLIPAERRKKLNGANGHADTLNATELFRKVERRLPYWCRKELMNGKPVPGKRSEVLWKLEETLIESGLSAEEAFILLKVSPWNKFRGRRDEDEQLRREIDKVVDEKFDSTEEPTQDRLVFQSLDRVEIEELNWLWYPYLARGELTIMEGDPGIGKSYLAQIVSGFFCDGVKLPSPRPAITRGKVVYFDIENTPSTVTKKRLNDNNVKNQHNFVQCEEMFSIADPDALDEVDRALSIHKPALLVFDTLNTYLGGIDAFRGPEVQETFSEFRKLARRHNCAVLVLRHLTKSSKEKAMYRGQGNIAFTGLARIVLTVGRLPNDPKTLAMCVSKINVARMPKALTFKVTSLPDTLKYFDRSRLDFGDYVEATADDILSTVDKKKDDGSAAKTHEVAIELLEEVLDDGPLPLTTLMKAATRRSLSKDDLKKAAEDLGLSIVTRKGQEFWGLP